MNCLNGVWCKLLSRFKHDFTVFEQWTIMMTTSDGRRNRRDWMRLQLNTEVSSWISTDSSFAMETWKNSLKKYHHKHQGLDTLICSVSRVTVARANASSFFQLFSFLVVCSGMISKGFGFVT